jgi:hypothetical protein
MRDPFLYRQKRPPHGQSLPLRKAVFRIHFASALLSLCGKKIVYLLDERVCIGAVNRTSILNGLAAGMGATEAMHADLEKELRGLGLRIKNIANNTLFCDFHN